MKRLLELLSVIALAGCMPEPNLDNVVDPNMVPRERPIARSPRDKSRLSAASLNQSSWNVVRSPTASDTRYRQALRWAEQACELHPDNANLLNTLGVAQYRVDDFLAARATLTRAKQLRGGNESGRDATWDLVFLAMTEHRLGAIAAAQTLWQQVQRAIEVHELHRNRELQAFVREARSLINSSSKIDTAPHETPSG